MGALVGRNREMQLIHGLLRDARRAPAALIMDGAAGIGKTTLCRAAVEAATEAGFTVLSTAGAAAEMSLAWAGLADLLMGIHDEARAELSPLHRQALQSVTSGLDAPGGDERLVAAAFLSALELQSGSRPVAIIVDDAQWLDGPSRLVLGFALRRLTGPVAAMIASRTGEPGSRDWLQPPDPAALTRLTVGPMNRGDLRAVINARLGRTPPAATVTRICSISEGNPFYALELARAVDENPAGDLTALPPTLTDLVRDRIGTLDAATAETLLTAAAGFEPTVDIVASAVGRSEAEIIEILQPLESRGILRFDGPRIRFTHPLIASGISTGADPSDHRRAHRRLADVIAIPEQRARHLALSTPHGDPDTLAALDAAAEAAAARGASSTAAELATLAIERGGDNEFRRLRGAELHFRAGDLDGAEALLAPFLDGLSAGFMRAVGLMLVAAIRGYRDGMASTIGLLERAVAEAGEDPMLRAQALMMLSTATGIGGNMATSVRHARQARADADTTGQPDLRCQALSVWVAANFIHGLGFDAEAMGTALELEPSEFRAPIMFRPSTVHAQSCAWSGRLDEASAAMSEVAARSAERGDELDVIWAAEQLTMIEVALGRYGEAERIAGDALRRAINIGGRLPLIGAYTAVAGVAAHQGRLDDTRSATALAVAAANQGQMTYAFGAPLTALAFVEVSARRYEDALQTLEPLLSRFDPAHDTEIMVGGYLPDAVEALTALDRAAETEPLVAALQANGIRHDRPWTLAVGARCRALVHASTGNLDAALGCADEAMIHHDRLPMPFERARTQLLLGQLQRRRRRIQAARISIGEAAAVFERIGSPLWSARAQRELERLTTGAGGSGLTDSERQIAEQAVAGLTNRQIAAVLFLSEKTVEMHLSNAYRKLGIRSRAQLAEHLING